MLITCRCTFIHLNIITIHSVEELLGYLKDNLPPPFSHTHIHTNYNNNLLFMTLGNSNICTDMCQTYVSIENGSSTWISDFLLWKNPKSTCKIFRSTTLSYLKQHSAMSLFIVTLCAAKNCSLGFCLYPSFCWTFLLPCKIVISLQIY